VPCEQVEEEAAAVEVFEFVYVRTHILKNAICSQIRALNRLIFIEVKSQVMSRCTALNSRYSEISARLLTKPDSSEQLVELQKFVDDLPTELLDMQNKFHGPGTIRGPRLQCSHPRCRVTCVVFCLGWLLLPRWLSPAAAVPVQRGLVA
jgi:hypothetical protein